MSQTKSRSTNVVDLCAVTDYSRDQMQGLLRSLPIYAEYEGTARVAREFSRLDTLTIAVGVRLESKLGMRRAAIAAVIEKIRAELSGARPKNSSPFLRVSIDPPEVEYLTKRQVDGEGMIVALAPVFERVDDHFNGPSAEDLRQHSLGLTQPLVLLRRKG